MITVEEFKLWKAEYIREKMEKMKMEGYNEIILCGAEMCRVLGVGLNQSWVMTINNVRVRDIKMTDDGKFKITVTDIESTLVRDDENDID